MSTVHFVTINNNTYEIDSTACKVQKVIFSSKDHTVQLKVDSKTGEFCGIKDPNTARSYFYMEGDQAIYATGVSSLPKAKNSILNLDGMALKYSQKDGLTYVGTDTPEPHVSIGLQTQDGTTNPR